MATVEDNRQIVLRLINEVMNEYKLDTIDELLSPDFVNHGGGIAPASKGPKPSPKEMFKVVAKDHHETMGNLNVVIHESLADGDFVVIRSTLNARHDGKMFGMPPTGNQLSFQVIHIYRVEEGLVTDHWEYRDDGEIFRQLETLPPPLVGRIRAASHA